MEKVILSLAKLRALQADPVNFIYDSIATYGSAICFSGITTRFHLFANTHAIKHVLFENYPNYVRPPNFIIDRILQDSSMFKKSDLTEWKNERFQTLNPLLSRNALSTFNSTIIDITENALQTWDDYLDAPEGIPIQYMVTEMTVRNLSKMLFGDFQLDAHHLVYQVQELFFLMSQYDMSSFQFMWHLPINFRRRSEHLINNMRAICDKIVDYCLSDASPKNMVRALANKNFPGKTHFTTAEKKHLSGRVAIFVIGGFESNTNNLIWVLYYLSQYPAITKKIYQELEATVGNQRVESNHLDKLIYMRATIMEILRLATRSFIPRFALEDDNIDGHVIKKHDRVLLPVFYMHHLPAFWPNPEGLVPERFAHPLPEKYQFAYLAFSAGPRGCIGRDFALQQIIIMLTMILQKYRVYFPAHATLNPYFQYTDPAISKGIHFILTRAKPY